MTVYEEELDLRPYLLTLIRSWWVIGLVAGVLAVAALLFSLLQPRAYEATATVLVTRSRTTLSIADQFPTVSEPIDTQSRMNAMLSIAESDAVAVQAYQAISADLPPENGLLETFKDRVEIDASGDLILIKARAEEPGLAAKVANAWARQTNQTINLAYSGEQPLPEIQAQLAVAESDYQTAQQALESFKEDNRISYLTSQVSAAESILAELTGEPARQIAFYESRKQKLLELTVQAEALRSQLENRNQSQAGDFGDALAVLIARATALGITREFTAIDPGLSGATSTLDNRSTEFSYQLSLNEIDALRDSSANYVGDLEALLDTLNGEAALADAALAEVVDGASQGVAEGHAAVIAAQLSGLQADLEREQSQEQQLTSQRDITWGAYQALSQKQTELKNAAQTTSQVTLASAAIPPQEPASRGTLINTLIAGLFGAFLGTAWVIGREWWTSANTDQDSK